MSSDNLAISRALLQSLLGSGDEAVIAQQKLKELLAEPAEDQDADDKLNARIIELEHANNRRAELLRDLLVHAEHLEDQVNPAGAEIPEPELYGLVREWSHSET